MSKQQHTRGPWIIKGTLFGEWHISSEYGVNGEKLVSGRQHVACSPSASSKLNPDYFSMFQANARLIAAAPELLEALEYAIDSLGGEFALPADVRRMAKDAIAKARGEA